MEENIKVVLSPEIYLMQIQKLQEEVARRDIRIAELTTMLKYERELRESLMGQQRESAAQTEGPAKKKRKRR